MPLERERRASRQKGTVRKGKELKGRGFRASSCAYVLNREGKLREGIGSCSKDEGEGFRLSKCIVCLRERNRAQGTLLKAGGWGFMPSGCAHVLKRLKRVHGASTKAKG